MSCNAICESLEDADLNVQVIQCDAVYSCLHTVGSACFLEMAALFNDSQRP